MAAISKMLKFQTRFQFDLRYKDCPNDVRKSIFIGEIIYIRDLTVYW